MRERLECDEELRLLEDLYHVVPIRSSFGDDNQEAIAAQRAVIAQRMTLEQAIDEYQDEADYTLSAALDAQRWLRDDDEPVSDGWIQLVRIRLDDRECVLA